MHERQRCLTSGRRGGGWHEALVGRQASSMLPVSQQPLPACPSCPPPPRARHGTHTAGIIGAVGNNAVGIAGLNWNIKLLVSVLGAAGAAAAAAAAARPGRGLGRGLALELPALAEQPWPAARVRQASHHAPVPCAPCPPSLARRQVCRFIWNDGSGYVSDAMNCIKLCKQEGAMITSNSWGGIGYSSAHGGEAFGLLLLAACWAGRQRGQQRRQLACRGRAPCLPACLLACLPCLCTCTCMSAARKARLPPPHP